MVDLHDLAAPYALDALDPSESERFEAHLATCPECRTEVTAMQEATTELAESVAIPPPAHLKESVMAATVPAEVKPLRRRTTAWVPALAAAAIAVVFFGLWVAARGDLDQANQIAAVYQAPDATILDIDSAQGTARFVYSPSLEAGVFNGSELAALSEEDVYQLWLVGDVVVSAGILNAGEEAVLVEAITPGTTLAMTIEVSPGVEAPTADPLFAEEI